MDKIGFCSKYANLIETWFQWDVFLSDSAIKIERQRNLTFTELQKLYVPRSKKMGKWDKRGIEMRMVDSKSRPVTLKETRLNPGRWDLSPRNPTPDIGALWPIPIAADIVFKSSIILDSNHLLANAAWDSSTEIPIVEIKGPNLEKLIEDFKILNRPRA